MYIYIIIAFILSLFAYFPKRKYLLFFSFIMLLFIGGFRHLSIGVDTMNYRDLFNLSNDTDEWVKSFEYGYYFLNKLIYTIGGTFQNVIFLSMLLVLLPVFIVSYRFSNNPNYSILLFVLLYFWLYSFNITRQYIATSILLVGYSYLDRGKCKKFLLSVMIAMTFHTSAIFSLFILFFYKYKMSSYLWGMIIGISFILSLGNNWLYIFQQLGVSTLIRYDISLFYSITNNEVFPFSRFILSISSIFMAIVIKKENIYLQIFLFGVLVLNIFSFHSFVSRVAWIYLIVQVLLIPNMLLKDDYLKWNKIIKYLFFVYSVVIFLYLISGNIGNVYPYKTCFN